jgi:hypothetical protein
MTDDDEMKELEARMSAKLFGSVATRGPVVVESRRLRGPTWAKLVKGRIEIVRVEGAEHPEDERFDVVRVLSGEKRIKVRSAVFRDEVDAAIAPYRDEHLEIKWLA